MNYRLRDCVWEITLACCFSCRYCGSGAGRARPDELTTEECLDVADQLAALGCRRVSLIGGEVFLRHDWLRITKRLADRGVHVAIITNGFLFRPDLLRLMKAAGVRSAAVSIDGPEGVHDMYRQNGSFRRAIAAVEALSGGGIPTAVITTLNRESAQGLEDMYDTLRRYPLYAWQIQACSPMGNAAGGGIDHRFDPRAVIRFVEGHARTAPFPIGIADNIGYFTPGEGMLRGNTSGRAFFRGCSAGLSSIGIDSAGNVRGCESMYDPVFNEGNLRERSLRDIWEDPSSFAYNRGFRTDMLTGPCRLCPEGWRCAGGCRSYNYFVHRELYSSPACARWYAGPED